jgi:hypothetical protein
MAVYVYGLTYADINVPGHDISQIGASTEPLAQGDLTQAIEDAAGLLNSVLDRSGITASATLDDDTHAACVTAVKAYAQAEALKILGDVNGMYESVWQQWIDYYATFSAAPGNLGDAYTDTTTSFVDDLLNDTEPSFIEDGEFDFFNSKAF